MTLFIRTQDNRTIVDLELWKTSDGRDDGSSYIEVSCSVEVGTYSEVLIKYYTELLQTEFDTSFELGQRLTQFINDFQDISELRGWMWERYFMNKENTPEHYDDVLEILRSRLQDVAHKYDLTYVED